MIPSQSQNLTTLGMEGVGTYLINTMVRECSEMGPLVTNRILEVILNRLFRKMIASLSAFLMIARKYTKLSELMERKTTEVNILIALTVQPEYKAVNTDLL